ncbi:MAG: pyridoxal phosphate-dependent aminotransferase [Spirochaetia bacterium]
MGISARVAEMMERSSWIRKMFETGAQLKAEYGADKVYDFSLGNPDADPPELFFDILKKTAAENEAGVHAYMPNAGLAEVRERIASYVSEEQKVEVPADRIVMSCGAGGGMNVVLKSILSHGEEVLVTTPFFMEYTFYAGNHGGKLVPVPGRADFDLNVENFERAINERTAAVIINSPNNPTGFVYPEETLKGLAEILEKKSREFGREIYLISDEPYRKIVFDGTTVPPLFPLYRNTIIVTSHSKDLSVPGERIGYISVHPEAGDVERLMGALILCTRILGFVNAPALMQRVVSQLQGVGVDPAVYKKRRDLLCGALADMGYEFVEPKGTFYLMPRAPGGDDIRFVSRLQQDRILTVPGRGFGLPGYFRIAFCVSEEVIKGSFEGFEKAIRDYR